MAKLHVEGVIRTEDGGLCLLFTNGDTASLIRAFEHIPGNNADFPMLRVDFMGDFSASFAAAGGFPKICNSEKEADE